MTEEQIKIDISNAKSKYLISLKKIEEESIKKRQKEILLQHENDLHYIKYWGMTLAELKKHPDYKDYDFDIPDWNSFEEVYMVGK